VCNISRIKAPEAKRIVADHLKQHKFIGHDAASYLAKPKLDDDVLDEISGVMPHIVARSGLDHVN